MSATHDPHSKSSNNKRTAVVQSVDVQSAAQRMQLSTTSAASAASSSAVRPPLSGAQRCADDALIIVFGFIAWGELLCAARTCHSWYGAAAKEKPRKQSFWGSDGHRLAALCASSSPMKRHISHVGSGSAFLLSLNQLAELQSLPSLASLSVHLSAADLDALLQRTAGRDQALVQLRAAFPTQLRQLTLLVSTAHFSTGACQLLLDALPAMEGLEALTLVPADGQVPGQSAALSLEPLLQLPHLIRFEWRLDDPTVPQLLTIKHLAALQHFDHGASQWTVDQLAALCRPPHRLQRLEKIELGEILIDAAAMADVVSLPALTSLELNEFTAGVFALLPRLLRLQRLSVDLSDDRVGAPQRAERHALLVSALSACPSLTDLTLIRGDCAESFAGQLVQAVPQLRALNFQICSLPSLRFLRHAPKLEVLSIFDCTDVRPGHVIGIGAFVPQLQSLDLHDCAGVDLDEVEQRLLTPPDASGLPHLRDFFYFGCT